MFIRAYSTEGDVGCLPVLIEWICDEFGVKGDVRQAVAVLHSTDHPRPVMDTNMQDMHSLS